MVHYSVEGKAHLHLASPRVLKLDLKGTKKNPQKTGNHLVRHQRRSTRGNYGFRFRTTNLLLDKIHQPFLRLPPRVQMAWILTLPACDSALLPTFIEGDCQAPQLLLPAECFQLQLKRIHSHDGNPPQDCAFQKELCNMAACIYCLGILLKIHLCSDSQQQP